MATRNVDTHIYKPVLCFGTFFNLLCQAKMNLGTRIKDKHDENREISDSEIFDALMCIVFGSTAYASNDGDVGYYKRCERNQKVPCQNANVLKDFNAKLDTYEDYKLVLNDVQRNLLTLLDPQKDDWLVKAIVTLLHDAVCDEEGHSLLDDGESNITENLVVRFQISATDKLKLWELVNTETVVSVAHFLLDVYRYILNNCPNNNLGRATYEDWCPAQQGAAKGAKRPFVKAFSFPEGQFRIKADRYLAIITDDSSSDIDVLDKISRKAAIGVKLPPEMVKNIISQIKTIEDMPTVRDFVFNHSEKLGDEVCTFCLEYLAEKNCAELRKLCQNMLSRDRYGEALFNCALKKLAKHSQSELYKVFETMHTEDSPVFTQYFDDESLLSNEDKRKQFVMTYLPDIQEAQAELPPDFEQIITNCNDLLRESQNRVRVYSWDELDFNSVYVAPFLNDKPNQGEETVFPHDTLTESCNSDSDKEGQESDGSFSRDHSSAIHQILRDIDDFHNPKQEAESSQTPRQLSLLLARDTMHWKDYSSLDIGTGSSLSASLISCFDAFKPLDEDIIIKVLKNTKAFIGRYKLTEFEETREKSAEERNARIGSIFQNDDIVYIVGGAGYGKSLFLKKITVDPFILQGFEKRTRLIIRGDIKRMIKNDGTFKSMPEFLSECFINGSLIGSSELRSDFILRCLRAGRCLILLDALDEVGNDQRNELHGLIVAYFQKSYPNNKVCITSRERGFIPRENITCFYITPITPGHVEEYIDNFIELDKFSPEEKPRFIEQASVLVQKGFVKGFLTLSLLMAIYKNEQQLPTNKVLLYGKCFEYIANTREKNKKLMLNSSTGLEYDWDVLAKLLCDDAFMEMTQLGSPNNADVPRHKIEDLMVSLYGQRFNNSTECKTATDMFLQFCSDRTEVFIPSQNALCHSDKMKGSG